MCGYVGAAQCVHVRLLVSSKLITFCSPNSKQTWSFIYLLKKHLLTTRYVLHSLLSTYNHAYNASTCIKIFLEITKLEKKAIFYIMEQNYTLLSD